MVKDLAAEQADAQMYPTKGNRLYYGGFYDRGAAHGEPQGSGPAFEAALRKFRERERQRGLPGVWRKNDLPSNGTQRDIDYAIMGWM